MNFNASHAPGPWEVHQAGKNLLWVINEHRTVATVPVRYDAQEADLREQHATARLISGAPDLLKAAHAALAKHQDAEHLLRHSIAKAST